MRFAELFAGAGGLSLGLERAGFSCVWHSEIAEFPRRVLSHRWPDTPLYGDVAKLDGVELWRRHGAIDLLSGGSPCQDLSVAGKRKGMTEGSGTRSSLFYEQIRLWNETGAEFLIWENVDGARSSNEGKDFGAVLSAIVGAAVFVPSDGWRSGGVAVGPQAIAAWRVLDAQFFGVPQRRRRVFVVGSRTGRVDPAEVLSLSEGLRGDTAPSGEAWEGIAESVGDGASGACRVAETLSVGANQTTGFFGEVVAQTVGALCANDGSPRQLQAAAAGHIVAATFDPVNVTSKANRSRVEIGRPSNTLHSHGMHVLAFTAKDAGADYGEISPTLRAGGHTTSHENGGVMPAIVHSLRAEGFDASEDGTGCGTPIVLGTLNGSQRQQVDGAMTATHGIPRRLMPIECERLMGWPDDWTNVPDKSGKPASDSNRYKACGNGVVSHCVQWIGERLMSGSLDGGHGEGT